MKATCDRCGFEFDLDHLRKEWTGFMVCAKCFDHRHPQDFVRGVRDSQGVRRDMRPEPEPTFVSLLDVGVNLSGMEYAWQGVPIQGNIDYVSSRGFHVVRVPFAWERMQPVLGATLDATFLALYTAVVDALLDRGCVVILDCHNYGRWDPDFDPVEGSPPGTYNHGVTGHANAYTLGSANLTQAHFTDLWSRMASAFVGKPRIIYGLMNEPHDLAPNSTNLLQSSNAFANNYGNQAWAKNTSNTELLLSRQGVSLSGFNDAWILDDAGNFGGIQQTVPLTNVEHTLSWEAWTASGSISCNLSSDFANFVNFSATTTKQRFSKTWTPTAGNHSVEFTMNTNNHSQVFIANACLRVGTSTVYVPDVWPTAAQAAITAIRAVDASSPIMVSGDEWAQTKEWAKTNVNMVDLVDTASLLIFDAHSYFDVGAVGLYPISYAATIAAADGYGAGTARGAAVVAPFVDWGVTYSMNCFVGEVGAPGNDAGWQSSFAGFRTKLAEGSYSAAISALLGSKRCAWWVYSTHKPDDPEFITEGSAATINIGRNDFSDAPQIVWMI